MKNEQPKIKIEKELSDKILETVIVIILILLWYDVISNFRNLPETIPSHFNLHGKADSFGSKYNIFVVPIISTALAIALLFLARFPHLFNYPITITEKNAEQIYGLSARFLRMLILYITTVFYFLNRAALFSSLNSTNKITTLYVLALVVGTFALLIAYLVKLGTFKKEKG